MGITASYAYFPIYRRFFFFFPSLTLFPRNCSTRSDRFQWVMKEEIQQIAREACRREDATFCVPQRPVFYVSSALQELDQYPMIGEPRLAEKPAALAGKIKLQIKNTHIAADNVEVSQFCGTLSALFLSKTLQHLDVTGAVETRSRRRASPRRLSTMHPFSTFAPRNSTIHGY